MTELHRKIPNFKTPILSALMGESKTREKYLTQIKKFERESEGILLDVFRNLDISATVKRNPYSLPFKDEITYTLEGSSYLNSAFLFRRVARDIVRDVLNLEEDHIRFYLFINVVGDSDFGRVEYTFRYSLKRHLKNSTQKEVWA